MSNKFYLLVEILYNENLKNGTGSISIKSRARYLQHDWRLHTHTQTHTHTHTHTKQTKLKKLNYINPLNASTAFILKPVN